MKVNLKRNIHAPLRDNITPRRKSSSHPLNEQGTLNNRKYRRSRRNVGHDPTTLPNTPMNNSQNIAQNQGIYDRDHRNGAVSPQNAHKESLPSNISIRVGSPNESSRFPSKLFEDSVELKIEDYENYIFDSLEEILIEMISSCLLTKGTQRKHYFFN